MNSKSNATLQSEVIFQSASADGQDVSTHSLQPQSGSLLQAQPVPLLLEPPQHLKLLTADFTPEHFAFPDQNLNALLLESPLWALISNNPSAPAIP